MTHDTQSPAASTTDVPPFPHRLAVPPSPLDAAERQYAEPPAGAPRWQPEEGDFN